jgi:hypothetical protein
VKSSTADLITEATELSSDGEDLLLVRSVVTADEFLDMGLEVFFQEGKNDKVSLTTKNECFVAHYRCLPVVCAMLWEDLQTTQVPRARVKGSNLQPKLLLMTLHHLKVYPTEKQAEGPWGMTRKTYRKWVKYFKKKIRRLKAEKIVWPVSMYICVMCQCKPGINSDPVSIVA